ncbi:N-acetyltransferase family protein [Bacteroides sp.]
MQLTFRKATLEDAARIWEIILQAKAQMLRQNKQQWDETYPLPENITSDISNGYAYVLCDEGIVIAYAAVVFDGEPAYESIKGTWLSKQPYVVVHRLAVADEMKQKGIATLLMQEVETLSRKLGIYSFKVDTNFDNFYMHKMLERLGFSYCGEITYKRGSRMAYEKVLTMV